MQRKQRSAEWGQVSKPTVTMSEVLDDMSEDRLLEMEQQVLENVRNKGM